MFRTSLLLVVLGIAGCSTKPIEPSPDLASIVAGTYTATGASLAGTYITLPQADASAKLIVQRSSSEAVNITYDVTYKGVRTQPTIAYYVAQGQQGLITLHKVKGGDQVGKFQSGQTVDLNYTENNTPYIWQAKKQ